MALKWRLLTASWDPGRPATDDLVDAIHVANQRKCPVLLTGPGVDLEIRPGDTMREATKRLSFVLAMRQEE
jgi:hypothetical protein